MSYLALARKHRPQTFQAVVGQDFVVQALRNIVLKQRIHHAYLLTGTRGVGKTTLARILAKALNCTDSQAGEPCGQCHTCTAIHQGQFADLIEIDAASRTKVEDTRDLLNNVQYAPVHGQYKIYIIDEVHMLSGHSFNALLKTLEEPPAHVIFILATTDPQRLPITVLSRCLQFHLKQIAVETIETHLQTVLDQENINADPAALKPIADAATGSLRDALSLLDQALANSDDTLDAQTVRNMLGCIQPAKLHELVTLIKNQSGQAIMDWVAHAADLGLDFSQLTDDLLQLLHLTAVMQAVPDSLPSTDVNYAAVQELATLLASEETQLFYEIIISCKKHAPYAVSTRQSFEMMLLRLLAFCPSTFQAEATNTTQAQPKTKPSEKKKSLSSLMS